MAWAPLFREIWVTANGPAAVSGTAALRRTRRSLIDNTDDAA
jgi:hypothetical protein